MLAHDTATPPATPAAPVGSIRRFYAYKLTAETQFTSGIWILYLQSRGLSLTEIGLAESAFHLAPVLLELPSGSFADIVGRRWSLAIGSLLIALSTALMFLADSLPIAMVALFLNGASYSFRSGADQAFLFDTLGDRQGSFTGILGKLMGASYILGGATIWIGAALSDVSYTWPFALMIGAGLAGAWLAASLTEPPVGADVERHRSAVRHIGDVVRALRTRPDVAAMLLFSGAFWASGTIVYLYLQAAFSDRGISNGTIGLILAGALVLNAAGAALAGRFDQRSRFRVQLAVLAVLAGMGHIGVASSVTLLAVAAYLAANLVTGVLEPLWFGWFNRQLPSGQRATLLSFDSWTFSLVMIVAFPLGGWFADSYGWGALFIVCGSVKLALGLLVALWSWLRRGPQVLAPVA